MENLIIQRIKHHKSKIQDAKKKDDYQGAYESHVILAELEKIYELIGSDIDLELLIRNHFYSSKEVSQKLDKSHPTIIRRARAGKLTVFKVGRDYFFKRKEIDNIKN